jgi:hypothetical protein
MSVEYLLLSRKRNASLDDRDDMMSIYESLEAILVYKCYQNHILLVVSCT